MHNIAKTFFPILLLLFAAVVTAQNGKNNVGNAQRFRYPIMQLQIGCRPSFPEQF